MKQLPILPTFWTQPLEQILIHNFSLFGYLKKKYDNQFSQMFFNEFHFSLLKPEAYADIRPNIQNEIMEWITVSFIFFFFLFYSVIFQIFP